MRLLLLAAVIMDAGCGRSSSEGVASVEPGSESAARIEYQCESERTVRASYPSDSTAVVEYQGRTLRMTIAISGSGARYVGDGMVWWTKGVWSGFEGTLFRHESDGTTGEIVEQCEQVTDF